MTISIGVYLSLWGCLYPSFYIQGGGEVTWKCNLVSYNMIPIRTLPLLAYFTYYFIDIIIYALGSTPWSSIIFWMVGRVVVNPSLRFLSLCEVVPWVPILVSSPQVLGKWVDAMWSESSLSMTNLPSTYFKNQVLRHEIIECFFVELIE
jgi:hypothetical protein